MIWDNRTWKIFAGNNFLGYEYAKDEADAQTMSVRKFGAPEKWGIESYKVELIPWPTVE
jgi:hypothetical protein